MDTEPCKWNGVAKWQVEQRRSVDSKGTGGTDRFKLRILYGHFLDHEEKLRYCVLLEFELKFHKPASSPKMIATRVHESAVVTAPIGKVWEKVRSMDFS